MPGSIDVPETLLGQLEARARRPRRRGEAEAMEANRPSLGQRSKASRIVILGFEDRRLPELMRGFAEFAQEVCGKGRQQSLFSMLADVIETSRTPFSPIGSAE
jgi:hypothetical protein